MSNEIELTDDTFEAEVLNAAIPVLVDFWAPWCGPCRMVAPVVEEIAKDYEGRIKVGKVNTDSNQKIAAKYGIMSIPTLMIFKGGKEVERIIGAQPKDALAGKIDSILGS